MGSTHVLLIKCRGRNAFHQKVLKTPVKVTIRISSDEKNISFQVICPHNTGSHGQQCKASHPEVDKIGDGIGCPYAVDLPYAFDAPGPTIKGQRWNCEICGARGTVAYKEGSDTMTLFNYLEDDHKRVSPECGNSTATIQVEKI